MQPVRLSVRLVAVVLCSFLLPFAADGALAAGEFCPDYHRENKELARRIKEDLKAFARSEGVPERLLYLYDQLKDCPACLGGDAEHPFLPVIQIRYVADDNPAKPEGLRNVKAYMTGWSADLEYEARQGMRDGYVEAFYIYLETTPCECCTASTQEEFDAWDEEPDHTESPTWDEDLDIDTSLADAHDDPDNLGEDPADLTQVPERQEEWDMVEPPVVRLPPPVRPMTTLCTPCRQVVNEHNDYAAEINRHVRDIGKIIQRLGVDRELIRRTLQDIRQWRQKAQVESVQAELDALWRKYGGHVASSQRLRRELRAARARLDEMMSQLERLKQAVRDCELNCQVQDPAVLEEIIRASEAAVAATIEMCEAGADAETADTQAEARQLIEQMKAFALEAGVPPALLTLYDALPLCPDCLRPYAEGGLLPFVVSRQPGSAGSEVWLPWRMGILPVLMLYALGELPDFAVALNFPGCDCCSEQPRSEGLVAYYDDAEAVVADFPLALVMSNLNTAGALMCSADGMAVAASSTRLAGEFAALFEWSYLRAQQDMVRILSGAYYYPLFTGGDRQVIARGRARALLAEYGSYENLLRQLLVSRAGCQLQQMYGVLPGTGGVFSDDAYVAENIGTVGCLQDYHQMYFGEEARIPAPPASCRATPLQAWYELEARHLQYLFDRFSQQPAKPSDEHWGLHKIAAPADQWLQDPAVRQDLAVTVAVIDSGLDVAHPGIAGRLYVNQGETPNNGVDDDGNGYVDDVHGWNFITGSADVRDTNGHGTMVAGIVAALFDPQTGMRGVNPNARIMPLKVTNFVGRGRSVDIAEAVDYAVGHGAQVINISLGGTSFSEPELAALTRADRQGVLVVVAAGNENIDSSGFWPAGADPVLTVAASDRLDTRAVFSNYGAAVDITAPGVDIVSLRARYTDMMFFADRNYIPGANIVGAQKQLYRASGTSFAAPYVSGVASALMSRQPQLTAEDVRRLLLQSALDVEQPGVDHLTGFGRLDAIAAMQGDPAFHVNALISGVAVAVENGRQLVRVTGSVAADKFADATVSIGQGSAPDQWRQITRLRKPVSDGVLADIAASHFAGAKQWTIRVHVRHKNGRAREYRFQLNLG